MASTIILLHLDEVDGVPPSDALGNLGDLTPDIDATNTAPLSVSAFTGKGRAFLQATKTGLLGEDISDNGTLLQRDATVQMIVAMNLAGATGKMTVIARGDNDGTAAQRYSLGVALDEVATDLVAINWFHQDSSGTVRSLPAATFYNPGNGKFFLLTATRRWNASDSVTVRYYVNDQLLAELDSAHGDIAGGTTGRTTVGGRMVGGVWTEYLQATIDELAVTDYEMSIEEIREVFRRLTEYQPAGIDMFAGSSPEGLDWYTDPGNNLGRRVKVMGQALGGVVAAAESFRALSLPDAATLDTIERWERLKALAPRARDSLDVRRQRVVSLLGREAGFSLPAIREALAEPLDVEDPDDIEILEFTNTVTDDFAALDLVKWLPGNVGTWSIVSGELHLHVPTATDIQWIIDPHAAQLRLPIDTGGGPVWIAGTLVDYTDLPLNASTGLFVEDRIGGKILFFGINKDPVGDVRVVWQTIIGGVIGPVNALESLVSGQVWLRISTLAPGDFIGVVGEDFPWVLSWSFTDAETGFTDEQIVTKFDAGTAQWSGYTAFSSSGAALASDLDLDFDDFIAHCPEGSRPFYWYAYRDPLLPGEPDWNGAVMLARKLRPAHTYAGVTQSYDVITDEPIDGLTDRGPLGSW